MENRVATGAEIIAGMRGREALLCNILDRVNAELLDGCPGLKVVANFGVGFNNIDVAAATARKIPVTNTPDVLTDATADIAFALLMNVARRIGEGERMVRAAMDGLATAAIARRGCHRRNAGHHRPRTDWPRGRPAGSGVRYAGDLLESHAAAAFGRGRGPFTPVSMTCCDGRISFHCTWPIIPRRIMCSARNNLR